MGTEKVTIIRNECQVVNENARGPCAYETSANTGGLSALWRGKNAAEQWPWMRRLPGQEHLNEVVIYLPKTGCLGCQWVKTSEIA